MVTCNCIGPQKGEPLCPCLMRTVCGLHLKPRDPDAEIEDALAEIERLRAALKKITNHYVALTKVRDYARDALMEDEVMEKIDLVEKLRDDTAPQDWLRGYCREAADEIERLRAALEPFALVADDFDADGRDMRDSDGIYANTAGDYRRARKALTRRHLMGRQFRRG